MTKCPECESDLELDGYELDVGREHQLPGVLGRAEGGLATTPSVVSARPTRS